MAWLLLAALPIHAESSAMNGGMHAMAHAMGSMSPMPMVASAGQAHSAHAAQANAEDCCRGGDHGFATSCHCAATCGTVLAAVGMIELRSVMPGDAPASRREIAAPDIADAPPLRPPTL